MAIVVVVVIAAAGLAIFEYEASKNTATLMLSASDAPANANISAVYITFSSVSLHSNSSGWVNYTLATKTVNIYRVTLNNSSFLGNI